MCQFGNMIFQYVKDDYILGTMSVGKFPYTESHSLEPSLCPRETFGRGSREGPKLSSFIELLF